MQPQKNLATQLRLLADQEHYLFSSEDLRSLLPGARPPAIKSLLSRAALNGVLSRVCRGLYLYEPAFKNDGRLLFHVAARLRADEFNYISLETALSDAGLISQMPMNRITLMSSGRSNVVDCGAWGSIEFVHTARHVTDLMGELSYDCECGLWRASPALALQDMRFTRRDTGLLERAWQ